MSEKTTRVWVPIEMPELTTIRHVTVLDGHGRERLAPIVGPVRVFDSEPTSEFVSLGNLSNAQLRSLAERVDQERKRRDAPVKQAKDAIMDELSRQARETGATWSHLDIDALATVVIRASNPVATHTSSEIGHG